MSRLCHLASAMASNLLGSWVLKDVGSLYAIRWHLPPESIKLVKQLMLWGAQELPQMTGIAGLYIQDGHWVIMVVIL